LSLSEHASRGLSAIAELHVRRLCTQTHTGYQTKSFAASCYADGGN